MTTRQEIIQTLLVADRKLDFSGREAARDYLDAIISDAEYTGRFPGLVRYGTYLDTLSGRSLSALYGSAWNAILADRQEKEQIARWMQNGTSVPSQ